VVDCGRRPVPCTGTEPDGTINRSMRILMLAQSYSPVVGGEERVVEDLSAELVLRGHDVAVATLRQPAGEPQDAGNGVRIHTLRSSTDRIPGINRDSERRYAPPVPDPETTLDLRRVVREERPEIVHAHNWLVHSYLPLDRRSDAALVLSLHDYGLLCATKRLLHRGVPCSGPGPVKCLLCAGRYYGRGKGFAIAIGTRARESNLRRRVDAFLPISNAVRDRCRLGAGDVYRVVPDFIRELPAPVDDPRLSQLPNQPFVLHLGDAREDKGTPHLVEVYRGMTRPPPLVLLGRWMLPEPLDCPGVTVLGPWPHELVIEALRRCMFTVAPSIWPEPFGLVALETAAVGKPIVASDIGGLRDIVREGETGLLVAPGDRNALKTALERLIADTGLRARMGDAGTRRTSLFSPEAVVPQFEEAYGIAVSARRARRQPKA
jgi:glycosyltransferase involved in cell wall biosynthesis